MDLSGESRVIMLVTACESLWFQGVGFFRMYPYDTQQCHVKIKVID